MKKIIVCFIVIMHSFNFCLAQSMISRETELSAAFANINSTRVRDRLNAADRLALEGTPEAITAIAGLLKDRRDEVRLKAVEALSSIGKEDVIEHLIPASEDKKEEIKVAALRGVAGYNTPEVLKHAVKMLSDTGAEVKIAALNILANFKDDDTIEVISEAANDKNDRVRLEALKVLGRFGTKSAALAAAPFIDDRRAEIRYAAVNALILNPHEENITALEKAMQSKDPKIRLNALCAVGMIQNPRSAEIIIACLGDREASIRHLAVKIIEKRDIREGVPKIIEAMQKDPDAQVRRAAIEALGRFNEPDAVAFINERLLALTPKDDRSAMIDILSGIVEGRGSAIQNKARHVKADEGDDTGKAVKPEIAGKIEKMRYHYEKAADFFRLGGFEDAIKEWEEVLKISPDHEQSIKMIERSKEQIKK